MAAVVVKTGGLPACESSKLCPSSCIVVDACRNVEPTNFVMSHKPSVISAPPPGKSATPEKLFGTWKSGLFVSEVPHDAVPLTGYGTSWPLPSRQGFPFGTPIACAYRK